MAAEGWKAKPEDCSGDTHFFGRSRGEALAP
jgi:hypothetical protein